VADPVLEADVDLVVFDEKVCAAEEEEVIVLLIVGTGARESVIEMDDVTEARRVTLTEEVPVGVRLSCEVAEGVAEIVEVRVRGGERVGDGETSKGEALLARQRVGVEEVDCVLEEGAVRVIVRVVATLALLEADPVVVLEVAGVRVRVPEAVCVRVRGGLRVGVPEVVDVLEEDILGVEVEVPRMVRDCGPLCEKDGLEEEVLDAGPLRLKVGLLDAVLEIGPLRVRVGLLDVVLDAAGEEVPVFVTVILLVAVAVDVVVRVEVWDAVEAGDAVAVLEAAPDFVWRDVDLTDLVEVVLGVGRRDVAAEKVEVVVLVDVLDCVLVAVGTTPSARWATMTSVEFHGDVATLPMAARSKSHRILSTTGWRGYLRRG